MKCDLCNTKANRLFKTVDVRKDFEYICKDCLIEELGLNDCKKEIDYSGWIGKPVFAWDGTLKITTNTRVAFFVAYDNNIDDQESHPFIVSFNKKEPHNYKVRYEHCRLIKDFDDLLNGKP